MATDLVLFEGIAMRIKRSHILLRARSARNRLGFGAWRSEKRGAWACSFGQLFPRVQLLVTLPNRIPFAVAVHEWTLRTSKSILCPTHDAMVDASIVTYLPLFLWQRFLHRSRSQVLNSAAVHASFDLRGFAGPALTRFQFHATGLRKLVQGELLCLLLLLQCSLIGNIPRICIIRLVPYEEKR